MAFARSCLTFVVSFCLCSFTPGSSRPDFSPMNRIRHRFVIRVEHLEFGWCR